MAVTVILSENVTVLNFMAYLQAHDRWMQQRLEGVMLPLGMSR